MSPFHGARAAQPRDQQQLGADFEAYIEGFSPEVQEILVNFEFRNQIPRPSKADALATLIETDKTVSPAAATTRKANWSAAHAE
ncbi:MAG: hypothetical protein WD273_11970 [Trueperaceae bacterium]